MKKILFLAILIHFGLLFKSNSLIGATGWYQDYIIINSNNGGDAYYWIGADPSFGTEFQSYNFGTVSSLVITGADMKYWSDNQDRTGGAFYYEIKSSDGSTTIVNSTETIWNHASIGGNDYQGTWSGSIDVLSVLKSNTTYQLHVWAKSWGSSQPDSYLSNGGLNYVATFTTSNVTRTWLGNSTAWSNTANWSDNTLPKSIDNVTIPSPLSNYPVISATDEVRISDLTIQSSASLTIESNATGTGSLIVNGTVSGNLTMERYIAAANWATGTDGWHLLSSPVASQAILGGWTPDGSSSNDYDFYAWNEANNIWVNFKNTTTSPTWAETNGNSNFTVGRGYVVAYQAESTNTFIGVPNVDDVVVNTLTRTTASYTDPNDAGFNVIGNPFPSAIKWNDGSWTLNNISTTAKLWNSASKSYDDLSANDIIPANNGFVVQLTTGTTGSITIPKLARTHSATNWQKARNQNRIKLIAREADNNSAQSSNIVLNTSANGSFDPQYDAVFLGGYAPLFYSIKDEKHLSTYAISAIADDATIAYGFVSNGATEYEIELLENIENQSVFITDLKANKTQKLSENPVYPFTSAEGDSPDRFLLHFGVVGLGEQDAASQLQAYVYGDQLYVMGAEGQTQLSVYDIQGRLVQQAQANISGLYSQSLKLPAGVYVVRLQNETASSATKIVIK